MFKILDQISLIFKGFSLGGLKTKVLTSYKSLMLFISRCPTVPQKKTNLFFIIHIYVPINNISC